MRLYLPLSCAALQVFSREAFQAHGHWLRYLHFTTESSGDHKEARNIGGMLPLPVVKRCA